MAYFVGIILAMVCHFSVIKWYKQRLNIDSRMHSDPVSALGDLAKYYRFAAYSALLFFFLYLLASSLFTHLIV